MEFYEDLESEPRHRVCHANVTMRPTPFVFSTKHRNARLRYVHMKGQLSKPEPVYIYYKFFIDPTAETPMAQGQL